MENAACLPLYAKLADRLSDHGLISIVTVETKPDSATLAIRDWLMSCRVLGRGVETFLMNQVVEHARKLGLARVTAEYIPTARTPWSKISSTNSASKKSQKAPTAKPNGTSSPRNTTPVQRL